MAQHRPTLGSRLLALRNPKRYQPSCGACGLPSPCPVEAAGGSWEAGDGPIPDGTGHPLIDLIPANRDAVSELDKRANRREAW